MGFAAADQCRHGRGVEHHFGGGHSAMPVGAGEQGLHDHGAQCGRHLHADLLLLVLRVYVDQTVHGGACVLRVQGGEHQVAGFHCGQCGGDGLQVSKLTYFDDVRVFAQRSLQRFGEAFRVGAHFALAHYAALVLVHEFDRVFDGDDVVGAFRVRLVYDRGQGGRLSGAGRAAYEHQSARQHGQVGDARVEVELLRGFDFGGDGS